MSEEYAMVNLPIPIRSDVVAQVRIPLDLTYAEAEKICRVVMALAKPDSTLPIG